MRYALLALLMLCAGCGCASLEYPDPSQTSVRIETGDKVCSATSVGRYSLLTARHCLSGDGGLLTIDGVDSTWNLIAQDDRDHVLIRVSLKQRAVAKIGSRPERGAPLVKYGNPM